VSGSEGKVGDELDGGEGQRQRRLRLLQCAKVLAKGLLQLLRNEVTNYGDLHAVLVALSKSAWRLHACIGDVQNLLAVRRKTGQASEKDGACQRKHVTVRILPDS
jgi:hypothetical protein